MRIKFRAWDKEENKMIYDVEKTYDYMCNGFGANESNFGDVLNSNNYIVMQYAEINDCNGRKIYDGDIIEVFYNKNRVYKQIIKLECGMFIATFDGRNGCSLYSIYTRVNPPRFKIIGNIYENPKLLEEK